MIENVDDPTEIKRYRDVVEISMPERVPPQLLPRCRR